MADPPAAALADPPTPTSMRLAPAAPAAIVATDGEVTHLAKKARHTELVTSRVENAVVPLPDDISTGDAIEEAKLLVEQIGALVSLEGSLSETGMDVSDLCKKVLAKCFKDLIQPCAEYMCGAVECTTHGISVTATNDGDVDAHAVFTALACHCALSSANFKKELEYCVPSTYQRMLLINVADALVFQIASAGLGTGVDADDVADKTTTSFLTTIVGILGDKLDFAKAVNPDVVTQIGDMAAKQCIVRGIVLTPDVVSLSLQALREWPATYGLSTTLTNVCGSLIWDGKSTDQAYVTDLTLRMFHVSRFASVEPAKSLDFGARVMELAQESTKGGSSSEISGASVAASVTWRALVCESSTDFGIKPETVLLAGIICHGLRVGQRYVTLEDYEGGDSDTGNVLAFLRDVASAIKNTGIDDLVTLAVLFLGSCRGVPTAIDLITAELLINVVYPEFADDAGLAPSSTFEMSSEFFRAMPAVSRPPVADTFPSFIAFYTPGAAATAAYSGITKGDTRRVDVRDGDNGDTTLSLAAEHLVLVKPTDAFKVEVIVEGEATVADLNKTSLGDFVFCVLFAGAGPLPTKYLVGLGSENKTSVNLLMSIDESPVEDNIRRLHEAVAGRAAANKKGWVAEESDEDFERLISFVNSLGDQFTHSLGIAMHQAAALYGDYTESRRNTVEGAKAVADQLLSSTKGSSPVQARLVIDTGGEYGCTTSFVNNEHPVLVVSSAQSLRAGDHYLEHLHNSNVDDDVAKCMKIYIGAVAFGPPKKGTIEDVAAVTEQATELFTNLMDDDHASGTVDAMKNIVKTEFESKEGVVDGDEEEDEDEDEGEGTPASDRVETVAQMLASIAINVALDKAASLDDPEEKSLCFSVIEDARTVAVNLCSEHVYSPADISTKNFDDYSNLRSGTKMVSPDSGETTGSTTFIGNTSFGRVTFPDDAPGVQIDVTKKTFRTVLPVRGQVNAPTGDDVATVDDALYYACSMKPFKTKKGFVAWWGGLGVDAQARFMAAVLRNNNCALPDDDRIKQFDFAIHDDGARLTSFAQPDDDDVDEGTLPPKLMVSQKSGKVVEMHLFSLFKKMPVVSPMCSDHVWHGSSFQTYAEGVIWASADEELFHGSTTKASEGRVAGSGSVMRGSAQYPFLDETGGLAGCPKPNASFKYYLEVDSIVPTGSYSLKHVMNGSEWKIPAPGVGQETAPFVLCNHSAVITWSNATVVPALVSQVVSITADANHEAQKIHADASKKTQGIGEKLKEVVEKNPALLPEAATQFKQLTAAVTSLGASIEAGDQAVKAAAERTVETLEHAVDFSFDPKQVHAATSGDLKEQFSKDAGRPKRKRVPTEKAAAAAAADKAGSPLKRQKSSKK